MLNKEKQRLVFYGIKDYPSKGGTSRVAENLIRNFTDYDVVVYCYSHPKAKTNIPGVMVKQFPEMPFKGFGVFLYYLFSCFHILMFQKRGSLVHAHKTDCAIFIPLLRLKFKVIITSHEAPYKRDKWGVVGKFYFKMMEKTFIHSGALLTSISLPLTEYYNERYKKNVIYIPNGINLESKRSNEKALKLVGDYNVNSPFLFFAARRLMFSKGIHTFINAVKNLPYKVDAAYAGEINHASSELLDIMNKAKASGMKYLGFISDLDTLLALIEKSTLFIFPSETEGMSIMLLEAASTRTPIICSDIPENTSVFSEAEVLYFKNKDSNDLTEKIIWALNNPELMDQKAQFAYEKLKTHYSWDAIAFQYKQLYKGITK